MKSISLLWVMALILLLSCNNDKKSKNHPEATAVSVPEFPYENYYDSVSDDTGSFVIGPDGDGYTSISKNIKYVELSPEERTPLADSLALYYNVILAYNAGAYDLGTAARFNSEPLSKEFGENLMEINVSGISNPDFGKMIQKIYYHAGSDLKKGTYDEDNQYKEVNDFYKVFEQFSDKLLNNRFSEDEFDASDYMEDYSKMHEKAIKDTTDFRDELLHATLTEKDFIKKTILAREFAYANFKNRNISNDKELIAVFDTILKSGEYSPLLNELWLIWRTILQKDIFGSPSNDGPIYNLFYNDMRNKVAKSYIKYISTHPEDKIAWKEFLRLSNTLYIIRNGYSLFGNNSLEDYYDIFYEIINEHISQSNSYNPDME